MLQFIYAKEIIYNKSADKEEERDAYFNAFEILQFRPINEADLSRGVVVDFKNGESRMYKCDLIDFMRALEQAKIKAYATFINESNGNDNNRKRKPKSTSRTKVSK